MALSEEQRRKLAAKAAQQQSHSGTNNSNIRRVSSTPSSLTPNGGPKKSGGVDNKKLIIGAVAAVVLIIVGAIVFTLLGKDKQTTESDVSVVSGQNTANTRIVPEESMAPQGTTEEISDVGDGPAIVDKRGGVTTDEGSENSETESTESAEVESGETESTEATTEPAYSNESYAEIVTPKVDEPELLESKLRSVLGDKYESLGALENFGIHVLSYDRVASNGYVRVSKALVDSGYDIGEHISTPLSINKDYEDGTQTARVTLAELKSLIDQAVNPTDGTSETETRTNANNPTDIANNDSNDGVVRNPVVDENTPDVQQTVVTPSNDGQQTANTSTDGTASSTEGTTDPMVGTMSGGEDFANSCYRVDETEPYDFDYLIQHINWSLTMKDNLVSVSKKSLSMNDEAAKDYIIVTLDPGMFCPTGRINFADFKKDLEASPYFVAYQRSGNMFSLVTDKTMINQGYANSALANAVNNIQ